MEKVKGNATAATQTGMKKQQRQLWQLLPHKSRRRETAGIAVDAGWGEGKKKASLKALKLQAWRGYGSRSLLGF